MDESEEKAKAKAKALGDPRGYRSYLTERGWAVGNFNWCRKGSRCIRFSQALAEERTLDVKRETDFWVRMGA